MSLVWERAPYSEGSLLVLLALADWADDAGVSWPSVPKLAHKARLQRRRVQYIIRKLQSDGFVDIEDGGGRNKQHRYALNIEKLKGAVNAPYSENPSEINSALNAPFIEKGALSDTERVHFEAQTVHSETQTVHLSAPDPLEDPSEKPSLEPPYVGQTFRRALDSYKTHRKEIKKPLTAEAERLLYSRLADWGESAATFALEDAVMNRWQGVFEPRQSRVEKHLNGNLPPMPKLKLPPLPEGVAQWACGCGFYILQNGNGIKECPECGEGLAIANGVNSIGVGKDARG